MGCTYWEEQQVQKAPSFPSRFHIFLEVESLTRSNVHCMTHWSASKTVDSLPLVFVFIQTVAQTPSKRRLSQRRGQLRFDTEKITVCKRSAGWTDGRTDVQAASSGRRAGGPWREASWRRAATTPEWWAPSFLRADLSSCDAPISDRQGTRWTSKCRNVGPFRDKRIISL